MNRAMKQQGFVNGGAAPIQSFLGNHSPSAIQGGVDPSACGTAFGMPGGEGFSQALDRIDFSQGALPMLMRGASDHQRSAMCDASFPGGGLGAPFGNMTTAGQHACQMQSAASPLSMLYHGATAALGGHNQVQAPSAVVSAEQMGPDGQQKRRFVWSPELHSRFEAAVNALGLDAAKPKSILRLMNVEGLTKANIKSHLQKYRCLMQKRASQAAASQPGRSDAGHAGFGGEVRTPTGDVERAITASAMPSGILGGAQGMPASVPLNSATAAASSVLDLGAISGEQGRNLQIP